MPLVVAKLVTSRAQNWVPKTICIFAPYEGPPQFMLAIKCCLTVNHSGEHDVTEQVALTPFTEVFLLYGEEFAVTPQACRGLCET